MIKNYILNLIRLYQRTFSPDHGVVFASGAVRCRFYPTCSEYVSEAVSRFGVFRGLIKGFWRILRCSPLSRGGVDLIK